MNPDRLAFHVANKRCVELMDEVEKLRDLLRWRDALGEPPTRHGEYLVVSQNYGGDYSRTVGKWNGNWPAYLAVTYWRPISPLPGEGGE